MYSPHSTTLYTVTNHRRLLLGKLHCSAGVVTHLMISAEYTELYHCYSKCCRLIDTIQNHAHFLDAILNEANFNDH